MKCLKSEVVRKKKKKKKKKKNMSDEKLSLCSSGVIDKMLITKKEGERESENCKLQHKSKTSFHRIGVDI